MLVLTLVVWWRHMVSSSININSSNGYCLSAQNQCSNQCWLIVSCTIWKYFFLWNLNKNTYIFVHENAYWIIVCKIVSIFLKPKCYNWWASIDALNLCLNRIVYDFLLTLNMRGPSYLGLTRSISWLLMQGISSHGIDYIEYVGPSLTWGSVLSTCVKSMWRNDIKRK